MWNNSLLNKMSSASCEMMQNVPSSNQLEYGGMFDAVLSQNVKYYDKDSAQFPIICKDWLALTLRQLLSIANELSKAGYQVLDMLISELVTATISYADSPHSAVPVLVVRKRAGGQTFAPSANQATPLTNQGPVPPSDHTQTGNEVTAADEVTQASSPSIQGAPSPGQADGASAGEDDGQNQSQNDSDEKEVENQALTKSIVRYYEPRPRCLVCHRRCRNKVWLSKHLSTHILRDANITCNICSEPFRNEISRTYHYRKEHLIKVRCSKCKEYYTNSELATHDCKLHCTLCTQTFPSVYQLTKHMRTVHGKSSFKWRRQTESNEKLVSREFECQVCGESCRNEAFYNKHLLLHSKDNTYKGMIHIHRKSSECAACHKVFARHQMKTHGCKHYGAFPCQYCHERFVNTNFRARHTLADHGIDTRLKCPACSKSFCGKGLLDQHIILRHKSKKYKCEKCTKIFISKKWYENHKRGHDSMGKDNKQASTRRASHNKVEPANSRKQLCDLCGKTVSSKYKHNLVCPMNTSDKTFHCHLCDKKFRLQTLLNRHLSIVHIDEKRCICDVCGKLYKRKEDVEKHKSIVHCDRAFVCRFCGRGFKTSQHLDTHERSHTGERPLKCEMCGVAFRYYAELSHHKRKCRLNQ